MTLLNQIYSAFDNRMAAPVNEWIDEHTRSIFINTLKRGQLPHHVAFIMDGNRRYASEKGKVFSFGHQSGAFALIQIVDSALKLGIPHLSMYAFSIENFNRSEEEVTMLFELLTVTFKKFGDENDKYNKCARVRVIGNREYIPEQTLAELVEIERLTANNTGITLNVCFAYTSRDEIAHAIKIQTQAVADGVKLPREITEKDLVNGFYFPPDTPPLDLLIRTSGHTRFSDFMVWQITWPRTDVIFVPSYWPAFSVFHFYYQLLCYSYRREVGFDKLMDSLSCRLGIKEKLDYFDLHFGPAKDIRKSSSLHKLAKPPHFVSITGKVSTA